MLFFAFTFFLFWVVLTVVSGILFAHFSKVKCINKACSFLLWSHSCSKKVSVKKEVHFLGVGLLLSSHSFPKITFIGNNTLWVNPATHIYFALPKGGAIQKLGTLKTFKEWVPLFNIFTAMPNLRCRPSFGNKPQKLIIFTSFFVIFATQFCINLQKMWRGAASKRWSQYTTSSV